MFTNIMLSSKTNYLKYNNDIWGTGCYYLNRNAMKIIYNKYIRNNKIYLKHLFKRQDLLADGNLIYPYLQTYIISKPTFIDECKTSTIHPEHLKTIHSKNNKMIQNYFKYKY